MLLAGIATFNTLIEFFGKSGDVVKAEEFFKRIAKAKLRPTPNTFTQMINIYGKV
jgi:pentatricopeptide repeat protein